MRKPHHRALIAFVVVATLVMATAYGLRRLEELEAEATAHQRTPPPLPRPGPDESRFIVARNGQFRLAGKPYRFLGVNVYSLPSYPRGKGRFSCGRGFTDAGVAALMKEVAAMGMNVVRVPAYQSFLRDPRNSRKLDFVAFDRIVAAAKANGIRLIVPFESQWWHCTKSGYKWADWYAGGYAKPYGGYRISYRDFVAQVVTRYRDEPTILMWQLMNEAESRNDGGLGEDPESLQRFVIDMAALIKRRDPNHLLSPGVTNLRAPGSGGPFYALVNGTRGIDAVEMHDYDYDQIAVPDDIRTAIAVAKRLRRPFYIGEVGIEYKGGRTKNERARLLMRKVRTMWAAGAQGIVIWSYRAGDGSGYDFWPKDPLVSRLRAFTKEKRVREGE